MSIEATQQSDFIIAPHAGEIAVLATSAVAGSQDLARVGSQVATVNSNLFTRPTINDGTTGGLIGHFATFYADGNDVYVIFGATQAAVTAGNVPVIATNGVNTAGCAFKIAKDTSVAFKITASERWIGHIGAANGQLRIARSSP